jgi:hypothetical protein
LLGFSFLADSRVRLPGRRVGTYALIIPSWDGYVAKREKENHCAFWKLAVLILLNEPSLLGQ